MRAKQFCVLTTTESKDVPHGAVGWSTVCDCVIS